jgi:hypothetical protein
MSTVNNSTDKVLIHRSGTNYSTSIDMSTVNNTDLLIVNRDGTDYKCTYADWAASQSSPPAIDSVTISNVSGGGRFTSTDFPLTITMDSDGVPASTKKIKVKVLAPIYEQGRLGDADTNLLEYYAQTSTIQSFSATSGNGVVITCADDTNFDYFEIGDYVRTSNASRTRDYSQDSTSGFTHYSGGIFDGGSSSTSCGADWYPNPGISYSSSVESYGGEGSHGYARFNGSNIYVGNGNWSTLATGSGTMTHFGWYDNRGCSGESQGPIRIDGVILRRNMWQPSGVITNVNPATNQITVNTNEGVFTDWTTTGSPTLVRERYEASNKRTTAEITANQTYKDPARATELYASIDGNLDIDDMVEGDPGWTTITATGSLTISFPATFNTGNAPDSDFPTGSRLLVEIQASNADGTTDIYSNILTPT